MCFELERRMRRFLVSFMAPFPLRGLFIRLFSGLSLTLSHSHIFLHSLSYRNIYIFVFGPHVKWFFLICWWNIKRPFFLFVYFSFRKAISSTHPGIALGCFAGISILGTVLILLLILTRIRSLQNKYEKSILSVDHEAVDPLQVMDMFEDEYTVLILTRPGFLYSYENESQQLQNSEDSRVDIHSYDSFHSGTQVKSSFSREKFLLWVSEIFSLAEKSFPTSPSVRVLHALALHTTTSDTRRVFSKLRGYPFSLLVSILLGFLKWIGREFKIQQNFHVLFLQNVLTEYSLVGSIFRRERWRERLRVESNIVSRYSCPYIYIFC